ncbi:MAG TPA: DUF192 domain-containing protein [Deinococcales bacterium]|nr:DUF192 domain-containing protein [Deinococcales bacterium]
MRLGTGRRASLNPLALLLVVPLALAGYLVWSNTVAQSRPCIESEIKLPAGVKPMQFGCGRITITMPKGSVEIPVEVAETSEQTSRGLMYRTKMAEKAGMVFLFPAASRGGFWMQNTLIPLSIAFFDGRGIIRDILDMEPCRDVNCPVYTPRNDYIGALEVNKGFFAENDILVGASVNLQRTDTKGK